MAGVNSDTTGGAIPDVREADSVEVEAGDAGEPAAARVAVLLLHGLGESEILGICRDRLGLTADAARLALAEARGRILDAARQTRDESRATAIARLNDLYSRAVRAKDTRTAMMAQRELNRLQKLYEDAPEEEGAEDTEHLSREMEVVRGHLIPLQLAPADYPLSEHARLAAQIVRGTRATVRDAP